MRPTHTPGELSGPDELECALDELAILRAELEQLRHRAAVWQKLAISLACQVDEKEKLNALRVARP